MYYLQQLQQNSAVQYTAVAGVEERRLLLLAPNSAVHRRESWETRFCSKSPWNCLDFVQNNRGFFKTTKGQIKSECIDEIIDFLKYHRKNLIDFCPESLFRLGLFSTCLSRVALRIIKTNHMYLVYKIIQGRNLSNFYGGILENQ